MNRFTYFIALPAISLLWACATPSPPLATGSGASTSARMHNEQGMKHYQMGHWDVAKGHFEEAIEAQPDLAAPHYNLGLALHKLGSHEEATTHFKQAAELAPTNTAITGSGLYRYHVDSPRTSMGGYY